MKKPVALNNANVKEVNRILILNTIRKQHLASRIGVSKELSLSPPTVSTIFNELQSKKIIEQYGEQKSTGGRKSILYRISGEAGYVLAVELKKNLLNAALFNFVGEIVDSQSLQYDTANILECINRNINRLICTYKDKYKIMGIGITLSGSISYKEGYIESRNLGIEKININEFYSNEYNYPVYFDDLIRAVAYYNKWIDSHKSNAGTQIFVDIGEGVGASIIIQDEIFYGQYGIAGELGHVIVDSLNGKECYCGQKGCLETKVSQGALIDEVKKGITNGAHTIITELCNNKLDRIDLKILQQAYEKGDSYITEVFNEAGRYFSVALINMIQLLDPKKVVIIDFIGIKDIIKRHIEDYCNTKTNNVSANCAVVEYLSDDQIFLKGIAAKFLLDIYDKIETKFN